MIWRRDVVQRQQINEIMLCMSTLNLTTLNSVVYFNVDLNNVIDNVETKLSFSTQIFTTLGNVETSCEYDHLKKIKIKPQVKNTYFWASKNTLNSKFSLFYFPFYEEYLKEDLQRRKILKTWNTLNYKNYV